MLFYSSSATPASVAGARSYLKEMAEWTGLEPATPGVTGRYSNQLNYHSACWWVLRGSNPRPSPCKGDALPAELSTPWKRRGSLREVLWLGNWPQSRAQLPLELVKSAVLPRPQRQHKGRPVTILPRDPIAFDDFSAMARGVSQYLLKLA